MNPSGPPRTCAWCRGLIPAKARRDAVFCGKPCRQWAFRLRRRRTTEDVYAGAMRFAYADPPYPGMAQRCYGDQPTFAGEVDHAALIAELVAAGYDGWALSTGAYALREVLPLCPPGARVCPWVKPIGASPQTHGLHNLWEPLIVVGGRQVAPGKRDWLKAHPARAGGDLIGRKPISFCMWMFECLGMQAGDELVDLYPGTGVVGRAWAEVTRAASGDASLRSPRDASRDVVNDASPAGVGDPSPRARGDGSREDLGDASQAAAGDSSAPATGDTSRCSSSDASSRCRGDASALR